MSVELRHHAKFRRNRSNRGRDMVIFYFSKMAAVRHLGFVMRVLKPPTKGIWWSLITACAKFGWNRCISFDSMHVFRFRKFGLKMPILIFTPQNRDFGGFDPLNGEPYE